MFIFFLITTLFINSSPLPNSPGSLNKLIESIEKKEWNEVCVYLKDVNLENSELVSQKEIIGYAFYVCSKILYDRKMYNKSQDYIDFAIKLNGTKELYLNHRADLNLIKAEQSQNLGKIIESIDYYNRAASFNQNPAFLVKISSKLLTLSDYYYKIGELKIAQNLINEAVKMDPGSQRAKVQLRWIDFRKWAFLLGIVIFISILIIWFVVITILLYHR